MFLNKKQILYTFQLIAAVLVALEISIPPNPYKEELILVLTILICIKHDIPNKIEKSITNLIKRFI
mgnify:FL=1